MFYAVFDMGTEAEMSSGAVWSIVAAAHHVLLLRSTALASFRHTSCEIE